MRTASVSMAAVAFACVAAGRAEVLSTQTLTLKPGWNAVYAEVAPTGTLDSVFASWPTDSVGLYAPSRLLATAQFSADGETLGLAAAPFATWKRGYPEVGDAQRLAAGTVLVYFGTNASEVAVSLVGVPAAPRLKWHASDTSELYNYVGFSLRKGERVSPSDYLDGFGGEYLAGRALYRIYGATRTETPRLVKVGASAKVSDGEALAMSSDAVSSWSGTLFVSPMNGLDFGTDEVLQTLEIRNDGTEARSVSVDFADDAANRQDVELSWANIHFRTVGLGLTNAAWTVCTGSHLATMRLAAGETWKLQVGLDRKALGDKAYGKSFGMIMRITDADGASKMRVDVPLKGVTSGGTATANAWPGGLWVADVALDMVKAPGDAQASETGGTLKLRLPIHVDASGKVRLLQRVVAAGQTDEDGYWDYRLYAGAATPPATARTVMRISAVCLPTETPVVEAEEGSVVGGRAKFSFTVAGDGATSILRHPYHPQHDGLRWDFKTPAPSGDEWANYKYDVKPETFSVKSEISLAFDFDGGEAAWNPEEAVSGTCTWSLTGLRHEGPVAVSGPMTVRRVSPKSEIEL